MNHDYAQYEEWTDNEVTEIWKYVFSSAARYRNTSHNKLMNRQDRWITCIAHKQRRNKLHVVVGCSSFLSFGLSCFVFIERLVIYTGVDWSRECAASERKNASTSDLHRHIADTPWSSLSSLYQTAAANFFQHPFQNCPNGNTNGRLVEFTFMWWATSHASRKRDREIEIKCGAIPPASSVAAEKCIYKKLYAM